MMQLQIRDEQKLYQISDLHTGISDLALNARPVSPLRETISCCAAYGAEFSLVRNVRCFAGRGDAVSIAGEPHTVLVTAVFSPMHSFCVNPVKFL
jgi:hypothetical protein